MKLKALDQRQAGILLPLFSLPGKHGIGDLGGWTSNNCH